MSMSLDKVNIGIAFTGSFCTYQSILNQIDIIKSEGATIIPIFSFLSTQINSRFGKATEYIERIAEHTGSPVITTIEEAEPLGPCNKLDLLLIAPCTGNTLAKFNNGITDTPALMAAKGHLRNGKPLVIFLSTNDALGINLKNIGGVLNLKHVFFVPFGQDNYKEKPSSMVSEPSLILPTILAAKNEQQLQPIILAPKG